ncbi:hypothetical protein [Spiroplasma endosymbiont of Aspidapion aeneum]|uniref:hypothetical protein n=1 Tax=Spiroplasma endosymbiont of Aspidapion aeneum TaxID=3066276 RepID=UPI00313D0DD4
MSKKLLKSLLCLDSLFTSFGSIYISTTSFNLQDKKTEGKENDPNGQPKNNSLPLLNLDKNQITLSLLKRNDSIQIINYLEFVSEGWVLKIINNDENLTVEQPSLSSSINVRWNKNQITETKTSFDICFSKNNKIIKKTINVLLVEYNINLNSEYDINPGETTLIIPIINYQLMVRNGYKFKLDIDDYKICSFKITNQNITLTKRGLGSCKIKLTASRNIFLQELEFTLNCKYTNSIILDTKSILFSENELSKNVFIKNFKELKADNISLSLSTTDDSVEAKIVEDKIIISCKKLNNCQVKVIGKVPNGKDILSTIDISTKNSDDIITDHDQIQVTVGKTVDINILNLEKLNQKFNGSLSITLDNNLVDTFSNKNGNIKITSYFNIKNSITLKYIYNNKFLIKKININNTYSNNANELQDLYAKNLQSYIEYDGNLQFSIYNIHKYDIYKIISTNSSKDVKIDDITDNDLWKVNKNNITDVLTTSYQMWKINQDYTKIENSPSSFIFYSITDKSKKEIPISSLSKSYFSSCANIFSNYIQDDLKAILQN